MLPSNLQFSGWVGIFKDAMMTAAIDRLMHYCVIVELKVLTYRVGQDKKVRPAPRRPNDDRLMRPDEIIIGDQEI